MTMINEDLAEPYEGLSFIYDSPTFAVQNKRANAKGLMGFVTAIRHCDDGATIVTGSFLANDQA